MWKFWTPHKPQNPYWIFLQVYFAESRKLRFKPGNGAVSFYRERAEHQSGKTTTAELS